MKEYYKGEQLYIIGVESLKRLGIRFIPNEVTLSSVPNIQDTFIVGRNLPDTVISSGQDTLALTLDFIAEDPMMGDVKAKCDWIRSLRYTGGQNIPQERVKIIWGGLFNKEVWVVRNVVTRYSQFVRPYKAMPKRAEVDILFGLDGIGTSGRNRSKNVYRDDIQNLSTGNTLDASRGFNSNSRIA